MIKSDQRSPNLSSEMLTGHPDRGFELGLPGTVWDDSNITCIKQAMYSVWGKHPKLDT